MYNRPSQVYCIRPEGKIHCIQRVKKNFPAFTYVHRKMQYQNGKYCKPYQVGFNAVLQVYTVSQGFL